MGHDLVVNSNDAVDRPTDLPRLAVAVDLNGRKCLVVGGGAVATRRVRRLLAAGAEVTVVAPSISSEIREIDGLVLEERTFIESDIGRQAVVIAATDDADVNRRIDDACVERGVWCNRADAHGGGAVSMPAEATTGRVSFSVTTGGASPSLGRWLARRAADSVSTDLVALVDHLAAHRRARTSDSAVALVADGRVEEALEVLDKMRSDDGDHDLERER